MVNGDLKVSVAMATYNGEKFVAEQLKSILNQSRQPDEIIICDDCSTDNTVSIIQSIMDNTNVPIVLTVNDQNLGMNKNFEKTILMTTGDIIFLSDYDDVWFKDKIKFMVEPFLNNQNVVMAYHDAEVVDENLKSKGFTVFDDRTYLKPGQERAIKSILEEVGTKGCTIAFNSKMKYKIFPMCENSYWSHDYWISTVCHAVGKVISVDKPLMYYRIHDNNISGKVNNPHINNAILKTLRKVKNKHKLEYFLKKRKELQQRLVFIKNNIYTNENTKLNQFIKINTIYIYYYIERIKIQDNRFSQRLLLAFYLLKNNTYNKYFNGYLSFVRDVLGFK